MIDFTIPLFSIICAGGGAFLGSYFKKKGENLATKEDFNALAAQTLKLTQITKEIEAKIDDQVWDRQRQWEMKRDVLIGFARTISDFEQAVMTIGTRVQNRGNSVYEAEIFNKALAAWNATSARFEQDSFVAELVISIETRLAMMALGGALRSATSNILEKQTIEAYKVHHKDIALKLENIKFIIRKELGVATSTVQSDVAGP